MVAVKSYRDLHVKRGRQRYPKWRSVKLKMLL